MISLQLSDASRMEGGEEVKDKGKKITESIV